jgi:alkylated DNA repair dioxygenase AlkB
MADIGVTPTLFPNEPFLPEGFVYIPDFISEKEERELLQLISTIDLHTFIFQGFEAKRKSASFGVDYHFDSRKLTPGDPIPVGFHWLIDKAKSELSLEKEIGEVLVLEYPEGAVINWHRDAPPFDTIIGISLLSDCILKLRPQAKNKQSRGSVISLPIRRRSLYVMQGAARSEWQHSTAPAKSLRYSVTLRTLK